MECEEGTVCQDGVSGVMCVNTTWRTKLITLIIYLNSNVELYYFVITFCLPCCELFVVLSHKRMQLMHCITVQIEITLSIPRYSFVDS